MSRIARYFRELGVELGDRWNRFWFTPSDVLDLCVLRIFVGGLALLWQLSFTPDLVRWFGPQGWFDGGVLQGWLAVESLIGFSGRLSFLYAPSTPLLWAAHILSGLVLVAFLLGVWTRLTSVLSFVVVLAYIHRAPFVCDVTEMVISMLLGYLCLAPCGRALSLDERWRRSPKSQVTPWATIARSLLQVHLVAIYAVMALSKLGAATWWNGEAIWWLSAQPLSRGVDLTSLRSLPLILNLWTYGVLIAEFAFVLLVWSRWLRPLVLAATFCSWLSIALATGNWALPLTMIIANLVFVPSEFWRNAFRPAETVTVSP